MSTTITHHVPPQRLINAVNPVVRAVLESPLHGAMDGALMVLHVVGRRTGRHYDIPVGYVPGEGRSIVVTEHRWRANLRGATVLEVTLRGQRQQMGVELDEDPGSVAVVLHEAIERVGAKAAQRQLGLKVRGDRVPSLAELEAAVREFDLAIITLRPAPH